MPDTSQAVKSVGLTGVTRQQMVESLLVNGLLVYLVFHLYVRSFTDGLDRRFGSSMSAALSAVVIVMAAATSLVNPRLTRTTRVALALLGPFVAIVIVSTLLPVLQDPAAGVSAVLRYVYVGALLIVLDWAARSRAFIAAMSRLYSLLLVSYSCIALVQFVRGHAYFVEPTNPLPRVAGLSSHPVTFSV